MYIYISSTSSSRRRRRRHPSPTNASIHPSIHPSSAIDRSGSDTHQEVGGDVFHRSVTCVCVLCVCVIRSRGSVYRSCLSCGRAESKRTRARERRRRARRRRASVVWASYVFISGVDSHWTMTPHIDDESIAGRHSSSSSIDRHRLRDSRRRTIVVVVVVVTRARWRGGFTARCIKNRW